MTIRDKHETRNESLISPKCTSCLGGPGMTQAIPPGHLMSIMTVEIGGGLALPCHSAAMDNEGTASRPPSSRTTICELDRPSESHPETGITYLFKVDSSNIGDPNSAKETTGMNENESTDKQNPPVPGPS